VETSLFIACPEWLNELFSLFDLFLSSPCPFCQRPGQPLLCLDCQQQLQDCRHGFGAIAASNPQSNAQSNAQSALTLGPKPESTSIHPSANIPGPLPGLDYSLTSWGLYGGMLKRAIAQLKYHSTPALAQPLGEGLADAWLQAQPSSSLRQGQPLPCPWVVPVPMHPDKQRQRGFNQAELIARSFCRRTGLPLKAAGLRRIQATRPQFELSPAERQRNVAQAFALGPALQAASRRGGDSGSSWRNRISPVLLLDDIYTTGATINGIAQILAAAQIPLAGVVVVARAVE
jgi:predicted amidophosphoribosyltransferase